MLGLDQATGCMIMLLSVSRTLNLPLDLERFNWLANHINCLRYPEDAMACRTGFPGELG
jgi:hypothetical protein